jgi:hypothetical protein
MGDYKKGDRVEAQFGESDEWFKGRIASTENWFTEGTVAVEFDDGDFAEAVEADQVRSYVPTETTPREIGRVWSLGDAIEGNYAGEGVWFKGRIVGVGGGVTPESRIYSILYDDGDEEEGVPSAFVRGRSGAGDETARSDLMEETPAQLRRRLRRKKRLDVGDAIIALFAGQEQWFRGEIVAIHGGPKAEDRTYDILYEDGDEEFGKLPSEVKPFWVFRVGDCVETNERIAELKVESQAAGPSGEAKDEQATSKPSTARTAGGSLWSGSEPGWLKCFITEIVEDGTYDVRYEDGGESGGIRMDQLRPWVDPQRAVKAARAAAERAARNKLRALEKQLAKRGKRGGSGSGKRVGKKAGRRSGPRPRPETLKERFEREQRERWMALRPQRRGWTHTTRLPKGKTAWPCFTATFGGGAAHDIDLHSDYRQNDLWWRAAGIMNEYEFSVGRHGLLKPRNYLLDGDVMGMVARCGGVRPGELEPQSFADVSVMDRRGRGSVRARGRGARKKKGKSKKKKKKKKKTMSKKKDRSSKKTGTTTPKTRRESKASAGTKDSESLPPVSPTKPRPSSSVT